LAGSPINADSNKTLASAASFTANLPPGFEVGEDLFFGPAVLPDLPSNLGAQHVEKLALHVDRERPFRSRKKHSRHSSTASDQDGHLGLQQRGRVIAQLPNRADSHVATRLRSVALRFTIEHRYNLGRPMVEIQPIRVELEREEDGRVLASVPDLPGVMAYGASKEEAV
jgi:hypothetical protein